MSTRIAGIDEVGRGALAGPVLVGAVLLEGSQEELAAELVTVLKRQITDSKHLTKNQRERASAFLTEKVAFGLGWASAEEVEKQGLAGACRLAATRALALLPFEPTKILADAGLRHGRETEIETEWFIKGDEKILPITCASILAKVARDKTLQELAELFPVYGWERNAGYGTADHCRALKTHGPSLEHRLSFLGNILSGRPGAPVLG